MSRPVLIAGAGIAGLALALALARRGVAARVLERRAGLSEAGAGIQLGPNAMRVLARLGTAAGLEPRAGRPEAIAVMAGHSGRQLARLPLGTWLEQRHGAPYRVAHRADLQAALLAQVQATPGIEVTTDFKVEDWQEDSGGLLVSSADGRSVAGDVLVGADGIWSAVRARLFPDHSLAYAGKMAARAILPLPAAGSRFAEPQTGVWLMPDAHVVHYPVRGHHEVAVVAIVDEPVPREGWGGPVDRDSVLLRLEGFAPELRSFLGGALEWRAWSLYDPPALPAWSLGAVGLIGDAAHPVLPFLAQGGALALEDAETLAALLAAHGHAPAEAWRRLELRRRARVQRVADASRSNGRVFHLAGAAGLARNLVLAVVPGAMMMVRYDWLYGWDGDSAATHPHPTAVSARDRRS